MTNTLLIIDYGSGNIRSAAKAFEYVGGADLDVIISGDPDDIARADRIVLPGQGAFGDCAQALRNIDGMVETLEEQVLRGGKPFLGICVGMQLLCDKGYEHGEHEGLGWIGGAVKRLAPDDLALKIPHMGWNNLVNVQDHLVLRSIESARDYYFVHSFCAIMKDEQTILAAAEYGIKFPAIIGRDNIIGIQFHPEKSQQAGLDILSDFIKWNP